jgi:hypothetical protein
MEVFASPWPMETPDYSKVILTPDIARALLQRYAYPRQRTLRPHRVRELWEMMRYGTFRTYTELIFARYKDVMYLVNGYHRLNALLRYGKPVTFTIVTRDEASVEAIDKLYETYDRELPRSYLDMLRASDWAKQHNVSTSDMDLLHHAMIYVISGFTDAGTTPGTLPANIRRDTLHLQDFMDTWIAEVEAYMNALAGTEYETKQLYFRAAVMSVGLLTLRYQAESAAAFWYKASHRNGFQDGDAEKVLDAWLRSHPLGSKGKAKKAREDRMGYAYYIASAWNAYMGPKGNVIPHPSCHHLNARRKGLPLSLHGTPFDGTKELWFIGKNAEPLRDPVSKSEYGQVPLAS